MAKEISVFLMLLVIGTALLGAVGFFAIGQHDTPDSLAEYATAQINVGGNDITVWLADTPEKQAQGLMGITDLKDNTGMLFMFADAVQQVFWNKDTLIDLDVIWIHDSHVIGVSYLPKQTGEDTVHVSPQDIVDIVLEVPAGWVEQNGVAVGSVVSMQ